ncbi:MAG: metallophosphoesterase family protein [Candidatus Thorarchaeota archaeon]
MIVAISDTHLGSKVSNKTGLRRFIREVLEKNEDDIDHLFLLGDIIDLWRRPNPEVVGESADVLSMLSALSMRKHYIVGNHDFAVTDFGEWTGIHEDVDLTLPVNMVESMKYDGQKLRFCHGHQIDYWRALSHYEAFCKAMSYFDTASPALSDVWKLMEHFSRLDTSNECGGGFEVSIEIRSQFEDTFAGPLESSMPRSKSREWSLLTSVCDLENTNRMYNHRFHDDAIELLEGLEAESLQKLGGVTNHGRVPSKRSLVERFEDICSNHACSVDAQQGELMITDGVRQTMHRIWRVAGALTAGLEGDEFLVRGHTHSAFVDTRNNVADAGCWLGERGSYITICQGEVTLESWP